MKRFWCVLLAAAAASGCSMKKPDFVLFSLQGGGCSAEVPSAWTVIENQPGSNPGVQFLAPPPQGKRAVRRYLAVDFYPAGSKDYSSIDDYIASHIRAREGLTFEAPKPAVVAGVQGKELVYRKPLPQSPEFAPKGNQVTRVLLFGAAGGFYALSDVAPEGSPADEGGAFDRLVKSFKLAAGR